MTTVSTTETPAASSTMSRLGREQRLPALATALFAAACRGAGSGPLFVVHASGPLLAGFRELAGLGARVLAAPNYRQGARIDYPPRNTPGSLLEAEHDREWTLSAIPICSSCARFPRGWGRFAAVIAGCHRSRGLVHGRRADSRLARRNLSRNGKSIPLGSSSIGLAEACPISYIRDLRRPFAASCVEATDALIEVGVRTNDMHWVASMWGFTLATWRLNLPVALTSITQTSHLGSQTPQSSLRAPLLHYSYGDELFNKHNHCTAETAPGAWQVEAAGASVSAWLVRRIADARAWYLAIGVDVTARRSIAPDAKIAPRSKRRSVIATTFTEYFLVGSF